MNLYFVSDVHTELRKQKFCNKPLMEPLEKEGKNILALCGDIGNPFSEMYERFIALHSPLFHRIFIVSGNHEYYSHKKHNTINETDIQIREVTKKFKNVTFLQKNIFEIDDFIFIGCTLWSNVDNNAETCMSDYSKTYVLNNYNEKTLIKFMDIVQLHGEMVEWLEQTIEENKHKKIIILTHHAPSFKMTTEDKYSIYYASDCEYLCQQHVIVWLSGHTHKSRQIQIKTTICCSNCLGYPNEKETLYNVNKHIVL